MYGPELNSDACVARNDTIKERVRNKLINCGIYTCGLSLFHLAVKKIILIV